MSLTRVTITGADNAVDPNDLLALSAEFDFVEWAFLVSRSRSGTPRYPSRAWINLMLTAQALTPLVTPRLAAHLCGAIAREVQALDPSNLPADLASLLRAVSRVQINGYIPPGPTWWQQDNPLSCEFILQVRREADLMPAAFDARAMPRASILFDPSAGRGIESFSWPTAPHGIRMGFTGGIKPHTIAEVLAAIGPRSEPFWIDMESGVRTGDAFDLALVRQALVAAQPFVVE